MHEKYIRIRLILNNLIKNRSFRNVSIVAGGAVTAQVITMAFSPFVTRIYGPEAFGLLGTFLAILSIVAPVAALTYPIAIVLPKSDADALGIAKLSLLIAILMSTIIALLIALFGDWATVQLSIQTLGSFLILIPVAMLFAAFQQILEQWLIRHRQYRASALVAIKQTLMSNTAKVALGLFNPLAAILVLLQVLSSLITVALLWLAVRRNEDTKLNIANSSVNLKELAYQYRDFMILRAPEVVINSASQSLPVIMLASLFGPAAAGYYTLGRTVLSMPSGLIGKSINDVFYPRISEAAQNKEPIYPLIRKATLLLSIIGIIPFSVIMASGPWVFTIVFGSNWEEAGKYAQWLALWTYFMLINSPSVLALPILKYQGFGLAYTCFTIVVRVIVLYFSYKYFSSALIAVALFGITGALLNITLIVLVFKKCSNYDARYSHG